MLSLHIHTLIVTYLEYNSKLHINLQCCINDEFSNTNPICCIILIEQNQKFNGN